MIRLTIDEVVLLAIPYGLELVELSVLSYQ